VISIPVGSVLLMDELDQDLEFASVIVQKLNIILITSPELADFRKRLKSLETRVCRFSPICLASSINPIFFLHSKTVRLSLQHCTDRGATTLSLSSRCAF
jgi:hypothetical protein